MKHTGEEERRWARSRVNRLLIKGPVEEFQRNRKPVDSSKNWDLRKKGLLATKKYGEDMGFGLFFFLSKVHGLLVYLAGVPASRIDSALPNIPRLVVKSVSRPMGYHCAILKRLWSQSWNLGLRRTQEIHGLGRFSLKTG